MPTEIEVIKSTSDVQSVAFKKSKYTKEKAVAWLKKHEMKASDFRETENEMRFRQKSPKSYESFAIKKVSDGINFILGIKNKGDNTNLETRNFSLELKEFNEEQGIFEGYASVFEVRDSYNDIIHKGSFIETLEIRKPKMLWQHDIHEVIGVFDEVKENEIGLYVKGRLAVKTQEGNRAYELLKMGAIDGLSIGFSLPKGDSFSYDSKTDIRHIKKINLFEISLVTIPANGQATVDSVKTKEKDEEELNIKTIEEFDCMKDFESFLKEPFSLNSQERKIFISKLKEFSKQRDAEDEIAKKRDVEALTDLLSKSFDKIINKIGKENA